MYDPESYLVANEINRCAVGEPCPVTDLFGAEGRRLLARLRVPEPWRGNITASVALIDDLEDQIAEINRRLKAGHADHRYIPLLMSAPGIGWVLAFTIAAEIGDIERFPSPEKLAGYTGFESRRSPCRLQAGLCLAFAWLSLALEE